MKNKFKNIKWEKGFLRIWVVLSSIWVLMMSGFYFSGGHNTDFVEYIMLTFGWPIGILVFAYISKFLIKFIIDGFK